MIGSSGSIAFPPSKIYCHIHLDKKEINPFAFPDFLHSSSNNKREKRKEERIKKEKISTR
jgi:hypothetical protein